MSKLICPKCGTEIPWWAPIDIVDVIDYAGERCPICSEWMDVVAAYTKCPNCGALLEVEALACSRPGCAWTEIIAVVGVRE